MYLYGLCHEREYLCFLSFCGPSSSFALKLVVPLPTFLYLNKFVFWVTFLLSYFVISHIFVS